MQVLQDDYLAAYRSLKADSGLRMYPGCQFHSNDGAIQFHGTRSYVCRCLLTHAFTAFRKIEGTRS